MLASMGAWLAQKMTNGYHIVIAILLAITGYLTFKNRLREAEISQLAIERDELENDYSDVIEKIEIQAEATAEKTKQRFEREAVRAKTEQYLKIVRDEKTEGLDDALSDQLSNLD